MAQIVTDKAISLRCSLQAIQTDGSQADRVLANREIWLVDTTNSNKGDMGYGKYDSYIVGDGTTVASELVVHKIDDDSGFVHIGNEETITGDKTFSGIVKLTTSGMAEGVLVRESDGTVNDAGTGADILQYEDGNSQENVVGIGDTVEECLTKIDTTIGDHARSLNTLQQDLTNCQQTLTSHQQSITAVTPVDVSSLFASTPILPTGYTFTQLRSRTLYRKVGYVRYPVTLKNTIAYYIDYNGTTMTPVSTSFSTGDYITVSGTLKDTNGNGISGRTITLRPVDTDVASGNLSATTGSGGAFSFSNVHTATDYTITLSSGTPNPSRMSAYLTTGNKTFNITV